MIDFHCHLDLYPDPQWVVDECARRGVYVLSVTTTPSAWRATRSLCSRSPRIRTSLGLHPQIAHERKGELDLFAELLPSADYVGEIGLDGSPEHKRYWDDQLFVFRTALKYCDAAGGRVMSIHSRRAAGTVLDELAAFPSAGPAVLHWYSGGVRDLKRAVDAGCWFSVGPAMLRSEKGRGAARLMPRTRVVTETDGPFAQLDGRPALPWDAALALAGLADIWNVSREEADAVVRENFRGLVSEVK